MATKKAKKLTPEEVIDQQVKTVQGNVINFTLSLSGRFESTVDPKTGEQEPVEASDVVKRFREFVRAVRKAGGTVGGGLNVNNATPHGAVSLQAGDIDAD